MRVLTASYSLSKYIRDVLKALKSSLKWFNAPKTVKYWLKVLKNYFCEHIRLFKRFIAVFKWFKAVFQKNIKTTILICMKKVTQNDLRPIKLLQSAFLGRFLSPLQLVIYWKFTAISKFHFQLVFPNFDTCIFSEQNFV